MRQILTPASPGGPAPPPSVALLLVGVIHVPSLFLPVSSLIGAFHVVPVPPWLLVIHVIVAIPPSPIFHISPPPSNIPSPHTIMGHVASSSVVESHIPSSHTVESHISSSHAVESHIPSSHVIIPHVSPSPEISPKRASHFIAPLQVTMISIRSNSHRGISRVSRVLIGRVEILRPVPKKASAILVRADFPTAAHRMKSHAKLTASWRMKKRGVNSGGGFRSSTGHCRRKLAQGTCPTEGERYHSIQCLSFKSQKTYILYCRFLFTCKYSIQLFFIKSQEYEITSTNFFLNNCQIQCK